MSTKFEFGGWPPDEVDDDAIEAIEKAFTIEAIDQALQNLAREGRIVDSGRRTWSEVTGRYEIVWVAARKKLN